jgi:hypothetical protein
MRRLLFLAGLVATIAMQAPADADARAGARSMAPRFSPPHRHAGMRFQFNRALAKRLNLVCHGPRRHFRCH